MRNVHRFGNEFWVEGDWHHAASVHCDQSMRDGSITFSVSFGCRGSDTAEEQKPYGLAIVAACDYAALCAELFKGGNREDIRHTWEADLGEFYRTLYKEWNPKK